MLEVVKAGNSGSKQKSKKFKVLFIRKGFKLRIIISLFLLQPQVI